MRGYTIGTGASRRSNKDRVFSLQSQSQSHTHLTSIWQGAGDLSVCCIKDLMTWPTTQSRFWTKVGGFYKYREFGGSALRWTVPALKIQV